MSSEWKSLLVSELADQDKRSIASGPFGSNLVSKDYTESGIPVIRGRNMSSGRWVDGDFVWVSEEKAEELSANLAFPGEIIFTQRGTLGQVCLVPEGPFDKYVLSQSQMKLRVNKSICDPLFMLYQFKAPVQQAYIDVNAIRVGVPHTNLGILRDTPCQVPPLPEQKAIAHILGTLDDKIELNRKTSETLEAMARALFKSWFVDFDPVRAKAEGRPTGLPAEISDLFPDSFEDSELGEIPSGWRNGEIQDIADLNPETWGARNHPLRVRYLDLSNVKHGKMDSIEEYNWEDAPSRARRILASGDTVVGTVRPGNGSYCLIGEDGITGSTGFAVLRPKKKNDSAFIYLGSCSKESIERLAHLADGGAYPAVRPELVAQTPVIIATRDVLDCFSGRISPLFSAAEEKKKLSKVLCQVRDALLPKLISGEIRIPDAEKMLEEVLS